MIAYRLCKAAYVALDGEGARLLGGRWNQPGRAMVYTAASPSLSVLEVLVHLDLPAELLPDDYRLLTIEIPDDASRQVLDVLPANADECVMIGTAFIDDGEALFLQVPSAVVPQECNALLNVRHPEMSRVRVVSDESFKLDPRLLSISGVAGIPA